MPISTMTSKGQTTIPVAVRKFLKLRPGDRVEFVMRDDGEVMLKTAKISVKQLAGILPPPQRAATLEEIQEAIEVSAVQEPYEGN